MNDPIRKIRRGGEHFRKEDIKISDRHIKCISLLVITIYYCVYNIKVRMRNHLILAVLIYIKKQKQ